MNSALDIAATMLGKREASDKAALSDFFRTGGVNLDPTTYAWCAALVNSSLKQAGLPGTNSNMARSFLNYGKAVMTPQKGDIAVFSRGDPNGPTGHVGFFDGFVNQNGKKLIRILGGNQGNAVSYANFDPSQLLGFRRPDGGAAPAQQPSMAQPPQQSLANNFMPEMPAMPDLGSAMMQGLGALGQRQQQRQTSERERRQALFGDGGVADLYS